jgi:hypothetical protein
MGWPVLALCFEACWFGELSQHPIRPHWVHLRRCSHHPPVAKQSTQPVLVGFAAGLIPSLKLHGPPVSFVLKLTVVVYMYVGDQFANIADKLTNKTTILAAEQRILGTSFRSIRLSWNEHNLNDITSVPSNFFLRSNVSSCSEGDREYDCDSSAVGVIFLTSILLSSTLTSYVDSGSLAGGFVTSTVLTSNLEPCQGHSIS